MKIEEALKILIYYQKWRRGDDIPQPEPKDIGIALDKAIELIKKQVNNT